MTVSMFCGCFKTCREYLFQPNNVALCVSRLLMRRQGSCRLWSTRPCRLSAAALMRSTGEAHWRRLRQKNFCWCLVRGLQDLSLICVRNLCYVFYIDSLSLWLLTGEKRSALLAEVSRLRQERNLESGEAAGNDEEQVSQQPCRGTVSITNIQLPLKVEFVCSSHSRTGNNNNTTTVSTVCWWNAVLLIFI